MFCKSKLVFSCSMKLLFSNDSNERILLLSLMPLEMYCPSPRNPWKDMAGLFSKRDYWEITLLPALARPGLKGGQSHQVSRFVPNGKATPGENQSIFWELNRRRQAVQMPDGNESLASLWHEAQLLCSTARIWPLLFQQLCTLYGMSLKPGEG